ncbi:hypothetical protein JDV02_004035 [Purpureocillium takamizusanense]|uniref:Epidermal growth factor receptor-like transmembrane-juxtamembrane segment domain-containing protein n=1 Tax=Purpureocillium takamizusanense TaxID=2060973 RepID=A0A9Q8QDY1_9HYPO|nr:uncharacterized protein JDV02_004035 [Purpureocillium takamizusanense]UNI17713.1 hypothetical protein JDV02_004035 [Purpureocillium takamizusanense]
MSVTTATPTTTQAPALTTTFTPESSCLVDLYKYDYTGSLVDCHSTRCNYFQLGGSSSSSACFPSGWTEVPTRYFSPGVCPSGYQVACSSIVGSETRATCCPITNLCTVDYPAIVPVTYTTSRVGSGWTTTVVDGGGVNAYGLAIRWKSGDFASATSTTTRQTAVLKSPSIETTGSTRPTNIAMPQQPDKGLSTGEKVGIAAGAVGAAAFLVVACLFFFMFLRRRRLPQTTTKGNSPPEPYPKSDLYVCQQEHKLSELPARFPGEHQKPAENILHMQ